MSNYILIYKNVDLKYIYRVRIDNEAKIVNTDLLVF